MHNYVLYTMVFTSELIVFWLICQLVEKHVLNLGQILLVVLILPIISVVATALPLHEDYVNDETCWLNFGKLNAVIELAPLCILAALIVILSEATSMRSFAINERSDLVLR